MLLRRVPLQLLDAPTETPVSCRGRARPLLPLGAGGTVGSFRGSCLCYGPYLSSTRSSSSRASTGCARTTHTPLARPIRACAKRADCARVLRGACLCLAAARLASICCSAWLLEGAFGSTRVRARVSRRPGLGGRLPATVCCLTSWCGAVPAVCRLHPTSCPLLFIGWSDGRVWGPSCLGSFWTACPRQNCPFESRRHGCRGAWPFV